MKALPLKFTHGQGYSPCEVSEVTHLRFSLPGPFPTRIIPVMTKGRREGTPNWTWNGDTEKPTVKPSILTSMDVPAGRVVCHSFITDGRIQFLPDCTHELAGQTVDLLEVDE